MKRILIATDGSPAARAAVSAGLELAGALRASVVVLYVRPPLSAALGEPFYQERLSRQLEEARPAVADALDEAARLDVEAEGEILEGDAAEEILALADVREAAIIAVGSRGLGAVAGALLGSVSSALLRRADRPVLVVNEASRAAA